MAKKKIAINGFGRIGRLTFRNLMQTKGVEVVAINDLTDNATLAHLLKYDSSQGKFEGRVTSTSKTITVNGHKIVASSIRNPEELPWKELGVDIVLECTGIFRTSEAAGMHLTAGAKKVLLSAPAKSDDIKTIVIGVNDKELRARDKIISNASCTTNCLAPIVKILDKKWGLRMGSMTTTHAYTSDQRIQDAPHSDLRRARAAAVNIIPTTTGAAVALAKVYPNAKGKLSAMALRVPVISGSLIELNCVLKTKTTAEEINKVYKAASKKELKGILEYSDDHLVSSDTIGNKHSSIFDSKLTSVTGNMVKIVAWYDNEAGYSARLADLATKV